MDRQGLYEIYQENLKILEDEIGQVKKMTQINLGKLYYERANTNKQGRIKKLEYDVLGSTRLYTFLLCSWLEARLKKILYENSSVAFTDAERQIVLSGREMNKKWRNCLNLSVCKSYGFRFCMNQNDYSANFMNESDAFYYQKVYGYLDDIEQAITIRNRLAHGQWSRPLNSNCSDLAGQKVYDFLEENDNIQKLDLLYNIYKIIAEVIGSYVVYKDKILTDNFRNDVEKKIQKIDNYRKRIKKCNFDNYCKPFYKQECLERECKKSVYKNTLACL